MAIQYYLSILVNQCRGWLFPPTCILCHHPTHREQDLCLGCLNDLPILPHPCPQCAQPLAFATTSQRCGQCLQYPPPFARTYALFAYQTPVIRLILDLKFHQQLLNARVLGELLAEKILNNAEFIPDVIVPIPLHPQRLRERGFNQALEIARPIAKKLRLPLVFNHCQRIKSTAPQMGLPAKQRKDNIKNAFQINPVFSGLNIAVVDDVITTGSTVREFCNCLINQGAKSIHVWCCARVGATLAGN